MIVDPTLADSLERLHPREPAPPKVAGSAVSMCQAPGNRLPIPPSCSPKMRSRCAASQTSVRNWQQTGKHAQAWTASNRVALSHTAFLFKSSIASRAHRILPQTPQLEIVLTIVTSMTFCPQPFLYCHLTNLFSCQHSDSTLLHISSVPLVWRVPPTTFSLPTRQQREIFGSTPTSWLQSYLQLVQFNIQRHNLFCHTPYIHDPVLGR